MASVKFTARSASEDVNNTRLIKPIIPRHTRYFFSCRHEFGEFIMLVRRAKTTSKVRNCEVKTVPRMLKKWCKYYLHCIYCFYSLSIVLFLLLPTKKERSIYVPPYKPKKEPNLYLFGKSNFVANFNFVTLFVYYVFITMHAAHKFERAQGARLSWCALRSVLCSSRALKFILCDVLLYLE